MCAPGDSGTGTELLHVRTRRFRNGRTGTEVNFLCAYLGSDTLKTMSSKQKKKIGEILVEQGLIDSLQLRSALGQQERWGRKLGETMVDMGFITDKQLVSVLGQIFRLPAIDISKIAIEKQALRIMDGKFCLEHTLIPLGFKKLKGKNHLVVAFSDPLNLEILDEVRFNVNVPILQVVATHAQIKSAIRRYYQGRGKYIADPRPEEISVAGATKPEMRSMEIVREGREDLLNLGRNEVFEKQQEGSARSPIEQSMKILIQLLVRKSLLTPEEGQHILDQLYS